MFSTCRILCSLLQNWPFDVVFLHSILEFHTYFKSSVSFPYLGSLYLSLNLFAVMPIYSLVSLSFFVVITALYTMLFVKHFFSSGHSLGVQQLHNSFGLFGWLGVPQYALIVSVNRTFGRRQQQQQTLTKKLYITAITTLSLNILLITLQHLLPRNGNYKEISFGSTLLTVKVYA